MAENALLYRALRAGCIISCLIPLIMSLILAPFLDSYRPLLDNTRTRLKVQVIDLDSPSPFPLGASLVALVHAAKDTNTAAGSSVVPLPDFETMEANSVSLDELTRRVRDGEVDGVVAINAGAGFALAMALGGSNAAPAPAITFIYDEGRSPLFIPRMTAPVRALLQRFVPLVGARVAQGIATGPNGTARIAAIAVSQPSLLSSPITFTETNLHPAWTYPVAQQALTVACVILVVMSAATATLATRQLPAPAVGAVKSASRGTLVPSDGVLGLPTPAGLVHARAAVVLVGSAFVGGTYALLVAAISGDSFTGGGIGWARMWGLQWLASLCYSWFLGGLHELTGDAYFSAAFLPVAYFSALAGWNIDLAPYGYIFFRYSPLYHDVRLMRHVLYRGALANDVGAHVAALVVWAAFGLAFYYAVALWGKPAMGRRLRAKLCGAAIVSELPELNLKWPSEIKRELEKGPESAHIDSGAGTEAVTATFPSASSEGPVSVV